jgi:hypothetical protein
MGSISYLNSHSSELLLDSWGSPNPGQSWGTVPTGHTAYIYIYNENEFTHIDRDDHDHDDGDGDDDGNDDKADDNNDGDNDDHDDNDNNSWKSHNLGHSWGTVPTGHTAYICIY